MSRYFVDLTHRVISELTILNQIPTLPGKSYKWRCICSCGSTCVKETGYFTRNPEAIKSCIACAHMRSGRHMVGKKSYIALPDGESAINNLMYAYKKGAKRRNLTFSLPIEDFKFLIKQNCFYCATPPNQRHKISSNSYVLIYNGIDRVNNKEGYILTNCVPCCSTCNRMKLDLSRSEFLSHIKKVLSHCEA